MRCDNFYIQILILDHEGCWKVLTDVKIVYGKLVRFVSKMFFYRV